MEAILRFLKSHPDVALATVGDDGLPKIRVFQIMKQDGHTLYFATAPHKEVYQQLQHRPQVEVACHEWGRIGTLGGYNLF